MGLVGRRGLTGLRHLLEVLCPSSLVDRDVRWDRSARRHPIGTAHAMHGSTTVEPQPVPGTDIAEARLVWIGPDDRGIDLGMVALDLDDAVAIVHVMPTDLRR